ncbi:unnamed protein product [Effrenium voratum]|nr:unnamed protein product [Effrenium voratum]
MSQLLKLADLLPSVLACLSPGGAVRASRAARDLHALAHSEVCLAAMAEAAGLRKRQAVRALLPKEGEAWSLERLHLCLHRPRLPLVSFSFASDAISSAARRELAEVAKVLRAHPKLKLIVRGMARPDAPPDLGLALSQARAVRVRAQLLELLATEEPWQQELLAPQGLREGGYDEGSELDDVLAFYSRRIVGRRIQAIGHWTRPSGAAVGGSSMGQCALIDIAGFGE